MLVEQDDGMGLRQAIMTLTRKQLQETAQALLAIATHGDCPQWVRNAAESIVIDAAKKRKKSGVFFNEAAKEPEEEA